jgi:hypothetical protein
LNLSQLFCKDIRAKTREEDSDAASLIARFKFPVWRKVELRDGSPAAVPTIHSNSISHHCRWRLVLAALLPAWACSQIIICQVITTYFA